VRPRPTAREAEVDFRDGSYRVKLATTLREVESAVRLRYEVFQAELSGDDISSDPSRLEFDDFDFRCRHLLVIDNATGRTVGTYRLNTIETAGDINGFYSSGEFTIEDLPDVVLNDGVEIGRACVAPQFRNTKVLFLLWKGLAAYLLSTEKRFFFGCCSIFTQDESVGSAAYRQLLDGGNFHKRFSVTPRNNSVGLIDGGADPVELPGLFNMYLRLGAKVCSPPMIDRDFGTIDFFVVCDTHEIGERYRKMFFR
jgi:putative hemolysin